RTDNKVLVEITDFLWGSLIKSLAKIMQIERRKSSLLEFYAEMQLILYKIITKSRISLALYRIM
uniref:hypothetical protein n=1 Tax=Prevotella sp. TaxID=59823 RepID=UPI00402A4A64